MDRPSDEVAELVEALPEHFRRLKPLFTPKGPRAAQDLVFRWETLGHEAVLGGEMILPSFCVTFRGSELPVPSLRLPALGPRRYDPTKLAALAEAARHDRRADQLLRKVSASLIERGEPLPPEIRSQVGGFITGAHKRPPGKRGKKREDNHIRDRFIALALEALVELGVHPTRNREQKNIESACSMLKRVLEEAGIHMTEAAVEKIWHSRPHEAPFRPKGPPRPRKHARPK